MCVVQLSNTFAGLAINDVWSELGLRLGKYGSRTMSMTNTRRVRAQRENPRHRELRAPKPITSTRAPQGTHLSYPL